MSKKDLLPSGWPLRVAASAPRPMQDEISRNVNDHVRTDSRNGQVVDDDLDDDDGVDVDESDVEHEE